MHINHVVALLLTIAAPAAAQELVWKKTYGGALPERGDVVLATSDGGYLVGGYTRSYPTGRASLYVIKTDAIGTTQWEKSYSMGYMCELVSMFAGPDSLYTLIGRAVESNAFRVLLVHIDKNGTAVDSAYVGEPGFRAQNAIALRDGGYLVVGSTGPNVNQAGVLRLNSAGAAVWERRLDIGIYTSATDATETSDGGIVVTGSSVERDSVYVDMMLAKFTASGDSSWIHSYSANRWSEGVSVIENPDGDLLAFGHTGEIYNVNAPNSFLVVRTDSMGVVKSTSTLSEGRFNVVTNVQRSADGDVVLLGQTGDDKPRHAVVADFNDSGQLGQMRRFGGPTDVTSATSFVEPTPGVYIITGQFNSDVYLMQIGGSLPTAVPSDWSLPRVLDLW